MPSNAPSAKTDWHRALETSEALKAEENAAADKLRTAQIESGLIPQPIPDAPDRWHRAIEGKPQTPDDGGWERSITPADPEQHARDLAEVRERDAAILAAAAS